MENELIGVTLGGAIVVASLVEALRRVIGKDIIKDRFTPALSILMGIGANILIKLDAIPTEEATWIGTISLGVVTGLAASGLYAGGRATADI